MRWTIRIDRVKSLLISTPFEEIESSRADAAP